MTLHRVVVGSSAADLRLMAQAVGNAQLGRLYTGGTTVDEMRAATAALLAHPLVRKPLPGVAVSAAELGGVPGEWVGRPPRPGDPIALFLPGGGYVRGGLALGRIDASELAHLADAPVFNLAYRQAPEHRFPAAFDDVVSAYEALLATGFDTGKILLVGESAGAGLALALAMHTRDQRKPVPAGVVAISALVDMTMSGASWHEHAAGDLVTRAMGEQLLALYMANGDRRDPRASPAFGRFEGLPPLMLHTGGAELLLSDVEALAERAALAAVEVSHCIYGGMPHGFTKFNIDAASVVIGHAARALKALRGNPG
ncbi:MAG: alpha/beta hydrolase fold domain-containing protein [Burkholderiales bacterium]|nr:alpha/beta hydrolase fold domain-containing protein [Burkholderiales bacterium]